MLSLHEIFHYFFSGPLEFWAFVTSLIGVWLMTKQWLIAWPAGLVSVVLYAIFFMRGQLYADATLQVFFFVMLCYGWWHWWRPNQRSAQLQISSTTGKEWGRYAILSLSLFAIIFLINTFFKGWMAAGNAERAWTALHKVDWEFIQSSTNPFVTFLDSLTTAMSLTAQWMQARKKLENWAVWIVTDIIYVVLYWYKDYRATSVLSVIYCVLAIIGHCQWRKSLRASQPASVEMSGSI